MPSTELWRLTIAQLGELLRTTGVAGRGDPGESRLRCTAEESL
jgi:hypothetical protein